MRRLHGAAVLVVLWALPAAAAETATEACNRLTASPYAMESAETGVPFDQLDAPKAIAACEAALVAQPGDATLRYQLGRAYDAAGDAAKAIAAYEAAGTPLAEYSLGALYEGGYGVEVDAAKAFSHYRKAAEAPLGIAREALGRMYEKGLGTKVDHGMAARLYQEAMDLGFAPASGALGYLYENGWGVEKDEVKALALYRTAADAGEAFAIHNTAVYHAEGRGGLGVDMAQAVALYEKAAALGWEPAMLNLGLVYGQGSGVDRDAAMAEAKFRQVIELDGALRAEAENALAWMLAADGERLGEAETLARAAVAASPEEANYLDTLAWVLHRSGQQEEALDLATKAVALDAKPAYREHLEAIKSGR
ncbi:SEL1-like repeat protein [Devosia sp. PTR5]|uniref:SEL1-like repeat protein n=1 Tax=Devosia oryzisoli TaxID=2774138 RepID=A0A927IUP3_9HYPH|nr:SEL1-like repeat protein [Devosia oryzisoli]